MDTVTTKLSLSCLLLAMLLGNSLADEFPTVQDTQPLTETLLTPQQALEALSVPDGFQVTLYAAEPDVRQPIAMAMDDRGRLWILENYTYAESAVNFETKHHRDRILIFEDTDQDGHFDERKVFWDRGRKATSLEIGFGGVWVTAAPNLLFIPDRDGNDIPDGEPEVILNGWDEGRVRHNIVNGLRWGPDGWLYGRHGIQATSLVGTPETAPEHRVQLECAIWRYHPTRRQFDVVARGTTNPWGMDWDEHGQLFFINTVIGHLWHVVPGAYYQRMYGDHFDPHVYELLPQTADHYHWDIGAEKWNETKKIGVTNATDAAGGGHAHQGMMIYAGDNWPADYRGKLFTFNFHGRRMNVDRLARQGATYVGLHDEDFLRTADPWFRGIEMLYGPDGGVLIADWSDIGECHENDGIHRTSGRLFKITHGDVKQRSPNLRALSSQQLVDLLAHTNEWYVRHARRLLQERAAGGDDLSRERDRLLSMAKPEHKVTHRLRAMWGLYAIGEASETWLLSQLADGHEQVRLWAVQLLTDQGFPSADIRRALVNQAEHESSGLVLCFLAGAMRQWPYADRWALARALAQHAEFGDDPRYPLLVWYAIQPAVTSSPREALELCRQSQLPKLRNHLARRLSEEIQRQPETVDALVQLILEVRDDATRRDLLQGMHAASRGWTRAQAPALWATLERRYRHDKRVDQWVQDLAVVFGSGRAVSELKLLAKSSGTPLDLRRRAIQSLVAARVPDLAPTLQKMLGERYINVEAIRGLAAYADARTPELLLQHFKDFYQPARQEAIATLVSRPGYSRALLAAIENGELPRDAVSSFQLRQMQLLGPTDIVARIQQLWPELQQVSAQKLQQIETYRQQLTPDVLAQANLPEGRKLFKEQCAKCHRLFDDGEEVGPALTGAQRTNLAYLLENIVDPSATVSPDYQLTLIETEDGRVLSGILQGTQPDASTVTLKSTNARHVLARDEIVSLRKSNLSLMPDRQLDVMRADQVRDLMGYLMSAQQVPLP